MFFFVGWGVQNFVESLCLLEDFTDHNLHFQVSKYVEDYIGTINLVYMVIFNLILNAHANM